MLSCLFLTCSRGNQRDRDRERAQARASNKSKQPKDDGLTPEQRRERFTRNQFSRDSSVHGASSLSGLPPYIKFDGIPEYDYRPPPRHCFCGKFAPQWTTWKNLNPGRRFYGCPDCKVADESKKCDYFLWHDDDFTKRAKDVIWYLYNLRNSLLRENAQLRRQLQNLNHNPEEDAELRRQRQSVSVNQGNEEIATNVNAEKVPPELPEVVIIERKIHELVERKMQSAFCKIGCVIVVLWFINVALVLGRM